MKQITLHQRQFGLLIPKASVNPCPPFTDAQEQSYGHGYPSPLQKLCKTIGDGAKEGKKSPSMKIPFKLNSGKQTAMGHFI